MNYVALVVNLITVLIIWNAGSWMKFPRLNAISFLVLTIFMFVDAQEYGIIATERWVIRTIVGIPSSILFAYSILSKNTIGKGVPLTILVLVGSVLISSPAQAIEGKMKCLPMSLQEGMRYQQVAESIIGVDYELPLHVILDHAGIARSFCL